MEFITYEVEGQVGIITINRPKASERTEQCSS